LEINTRYFNDDLSREDKHYIIMHEVTHSLAFLIIDAYTDNWTSYETGETHSAILQTVNWRGTSNKIIVTPKVVEKARELYNCPTLEGMSLE
jgi:hypothetical protein